MAWAWTSSRTRARSPSRDGKPGAGGAAPADLSGKKASEVYQNVKVLGDLDEGQFNRLMAAITEVGGAREEGCNYCHNRKTLPTTTIYTKVVARRMLQMTANINQSWEKHVAKTGVTCWTCHRGHPVPQQVWYKGDGPTVRRWA